MKTILVDSPFANLANIRRALVACGADLEVNFDPAAIEGAQTIVLPGVGSFAAAARWLRANGIAEALASAAAKGATILGICVGHQLLFDDSDEDGAEKGLALISGNVRRYDGPLPVPQIGWNAVEHDGDPLFDGVEPGTPFYFVNSYRATRVATEDEIGFATYGERFTAAVRRGSIYGVQFHPEKSSTSGLEVLRNFVRLSRHRGTAAPQHAAEERRPPA